MVSKPYLSLFAAAVMAVISSDHCRSDDVDDRAVSVVKSAWGEYARRLSQMHQKIQTQVVDHGSGKAVTNRHHGEIKRAGDWLVAITTECDSTGKALASKARGLNSRYGFTVSRAAPDAPWVLEDLITDLKKEGQPWLRNLRERHLGPRFPALDFVGGENLARLIEEPNFTVTKTETVERDGQQFLRLSFDRKGLGSEGNVRGGNVLLDARRAWLISEGNLTMQFVHGSEQVQATLKNEYADQIVDNVPLLRRRVIDMKGRRIIGAGQFRPNMPYPGQSNPPPPSLPQSEERSEPINVTWVIEYEQSLLENPQEKDFTLETVFKFDFKTNLWEGEAPAEPISSRIYRLTARQEPRSPNLKTVS